jgi:2-keto-3-deoxy-L-rhamnonate aldolase RhmA
MQENMIKKAVREGGIAIGTNVNEFPTRGLPKLLEYAGLDWAFIDMEHSGFTMDRVADLLAWFKATPITVLVRPPDNMYHMLAGIMDAGAMGVVAPNVRSAEEARAIVDAVMYPPLGHRGVGLNAAHTDFKKPQASEYMPARNAQTSVVACIESPEGLANIDEIAAVEGVDIVHPSQTDLTISMGIAQQFEHPRFREAQRSISGACVRHGKASMFIPRSDADLASFYAQGCRVILMRGVCDIFQEAMKSNADHWREQVAGLAR